MGEQPLANAAGRKATIYLVNSDRAACERIAAALRERQYDVRIFSCADEFLAQVAPPVESVMVVDNSLNDMSGISLIRELHDRGLRIPTVMTTNVGNIPNAVSAIREGVTDVLESPLSDRRLTQSIERALKSSDE